MNRRVALVLLFLVSSACARDAAQDRARGGEPDARIATSIAETAQRGGGGGGGGGGGRHRHAKTGTTAFIANDETPFTTGGAGGSRGSAPGGGTGLATGGGQTAKMEAGTPAHGQRRQPPTAVYLDGVPLAGIAFGDLPPNLKETWVTFDDGNKVRRFGVADYLSALGVDLRKIKALHFHSGRKRVGMLSGEQFRKNGRGIQFSFTQDTAGKTRMHFPPDSGISTAIDRLWALAIYSDKTPPIVDDVTHVLMLDGKPVTRLPYVTQELGGGARVYLDGHIAGTLKRAELATKTATATSLAMTAGEALASVHIDLAKVRSVVLVGDDAEVARPDVRAFRDTVLRFDEQAGGYFKLPGGEQANVIQLLVNMRPRPSPKRP